MCDHLARSGGVLDVPRDSLVCLDIIQDPNPTWASLGTTRHESHPVRRYSNPTASTEAPAAADPTVGSAPSFATAATHAT